MTVKAFNNYRPLTHSELESVLADDRYRSVSTLTDLEKLTDYLRADRDELPR